MTLLTTLLASHRAKAEAATNRSRQSVWAATKNPHTTHAMNYDIYADESLICLATEPDAAHIAANDPATVLALLDVVEAAENAAERLSSYVYRSTSDGECEHGFWNEECPNPVCGVRDERKELATLRVALDRAKEVLR